MADRIEQTSTPAESAQDGLITVIVPVYNVGDYLATCLESILAQTHQSMHVVIVNDGSTDASTQICRDYAARDSRILLVEQENAGLSAARNTGLAHVRGDYVCFIDSDDELEPNYLERLYEAIRTWDADFVACGYRLVDEADAVIRETRLEEGLRDERAFWKDVTDPGLLNFYVWNKLYRLDFIGNSRFPVGKRSQDKAFHLDVVPRAERIYFLSEPLYRYRVRSSSITNSLAAKHILDPIEFDIDNIDLYEQQGYYEYIPHMLHCTIAHLARIQPKPGDVTEEERYRSYWEATERIYAKELKRGSLPFSLRARYRALKLIGPARYLCLSQMLRRIKPAG